MNLKFFLIFFQIFLAKSIRKLNNAYEIKIITEGDGSQIILSSDEFKPDKVLMNGVVQEVSTIYYLVYQEINNFTIIWEKMPKCSGMFEYSTGIVSIDLSNFDSSQLIDISKMFRECRNLRYINFTNFDVSLVENMTQLFYGCTKLTSLDLSNFYTFSAISMESMFQGADSLISLDLRAFDTSFVTNMKNMFNGCKSLKYINLISFVENQNLVIENIFSDDINNLIYCIDEENAPMINQALKWTNFRNDCENPYFIEEKTNENNCEDNNCENEVKTKESEIMKYNDKDIEILSSNILSDSEISSSYSQADYINIKSPSEIVFEKSQEILFDEPTEFDEEENGNEIKNLKEFILNNFDSIVSNIINGTKEDVIGEYNNITYQITTTENQKNNNYTNISTINLGECEEKLKGVYGIDPNISLIILKIDYNVPYLLIPLIGYEVYHPINKSKLDLNYCNDSLIKLNIPVTINEDKIYIYDPNSEYYNDECFAYTTENGTDIILNDRKNEFTDNNLSLCENNCTFKGYDSDTNKALCECEIKIDINTIYEMLSEGNILSNYFNSTDSSSLNIGTMKCISLLFSKNGLLKNLGSYILIFTILLFIISIVIFYKCGYQIIQNKINDILDLKIKYKNNTDIFELKKKIYNKKNNIKKRKKSNLSNPNKKKKKNNISHFNYKSKKKDSSYSNIPFSKTDLKNTKVLINNDKESMVVYKSKISNSREKNYNNKINLKEFEINSFSYEEAFELDKRRYHEYYFSLIKTKVPFLLAFYPIDDYNIQIIKICLFFQFFIIYIAVNTFFFNESTIHQIYKDGGKYNFLYFFPQIIYSFIICYISTSFIKYFSLSENNLLELKRETNPNKIYDKANNTKTCLIIKYILFFIINFVFLIFFWFYLSSFCAVYNNTQIYVIINALLSFIISIIYVFIFNIFPTIFRIISLKEKNSINISFYKISKIIQLM